MKIAFLLYPTQKIKPSEDTSFWIMHELIRRGHAVRHFESSDLFLDNFSAKAVLKESVLDPLWGFGRTTFSSKASDLSEQDAIFIRKEPPFDNAYLYSLQILETLRDKVFILNDPRSMAILNEKTSILDFPGLAPRTLVSENKGRLLGFTKSLGGLAVLKPLNDKAGHGVSLLDLKKKSSLRAIDALTEGGRYKVMAQQFIKNRGLEDKRIVLLDGKPLGVFARKASPADFRSNLSLGGTMHAVSLSAADKRIIEKLSPLLRKNGLYFVGIDVIGKYLTEINLTSPSGIPELKELCGTSPEKNVADFIESRIRRRSR